LAAVKGKIRIHQEKNRKKIKTKEKIIAEKSSNQGHQTYKGAWFVHQATISFHLTSQTTKKGLKDRGKNKDQQSFLFSTLYQPP